MNSATEAVRMNPDAQPLDAAFEPTSANTPRSASSGDGYDPVIEDFNAFFERLSTLDDLSWIGEDDPDQPAEQRARAKAAKTVMAARPPVARGRASGSPTTADPKAGAQRQRQSQADRSTAPASRARTKRPTAAQPAAQPPLGMTVLHSSEMAEEQHSSAAHSQRGAAALASAETAGQGPVFGAAASSAARAAMKPTPGMRLAGALKMLMIGLLLFLFGIGAGWAALSLPARIQDHGALLARTTNIAPGAGRAAAPRTLPAAIETDSESPQALTMTGRKLTDSKLADEEGTDDSTQDTAAASLAAEDIELPVMKVDAAPRSPTHPVRTATRTPARPAADVDSNTPHFALQVGACASNTCVASYMQRLLGHVDAGSLHVIRQEVEPGRVLQRIRVEPLSHDEGVALKTALAEVDGGLAGAYLVRMP